MEDQWPKAHDFFGSIHKVGAVDPAAHAYDAVEILATAGLADMVHHTIQLGAAFRARIPVGLDLDAEGIAMIANAVLVEGDGAIGGVHHAVSANAVLPIRIKRLP